MAVVDFDFIYFDFSDYCIEEFDKIGVSLVDVGAQGASFGGHVGISIDEIIMICFGITILFSIIPPMMNPNGVNILDFPISFFNALNFLWFDNLNFFNSDSASSCPSAIMSTPLFLTRQNVIEELNKTNDLPQNKTNESVKSKPGFFDMIKYPEFRDMIFKNAFFGFSGSDIVKKIVDADPTGVVSFLVNLFILVSDFFKELIFFIVNFFVSFVKIFVGCGVGGMRLLIGIALVSIILVKSIGVLGGLSQIINMFSNIIR
ncbi:MAG: hypothetical protein ABIM64_01705 [candidate division WOR-3 bacterium]